MGRSARFAVLAILAVLGTLSITRLPRFAIYANERDAARLVRSLAIQLESETGSVLGALRAERGSAADAPGERWLDLNPELRPAPPAGPPERAGAGLVTTDPELPAWTRLPDLEWLPDRGLLRRHGYLFRARRGHRGVWVEAWPWDHGQTGLAAFRQGPQAPLEVHPNGAGSSSGVARQPSEF
ncbi:MAG: hypothetical protein ACYS26_18205, partial [Planctomycetota bacterium]